MDTRRHLEHSLSIAEVDRSQTPWPNRLRSGHGARVGSNCVMPVVELEQCAPNQRRSPTQNDGGSDDEVWIWPCRLGRNTWLPIFNRCLSISVSFGPPSSSPGATQGGSSRLSKAST